MDVAPSSRRGRGARNPFPKEQELRFFRFLVILSSALVGVNGLLGGFAAVSNPESPFGLSTAVLKNGGFHNFLVPGLFLLVVIGLGDLLAAACVLKGARHHEYVLGTMSLVTIGWIAVQVYVMMEINGLHVAILSLGAFQGGYAVYLLVRDNKFPFSLV